jgi:hypothetical protein
VSTNSSALKFVPDFLLRKMKINPFKFFSHNPNNNIFRFITYVYSGYYAPKIRDYAKEKMDEMKQKDVTITMIITRVPRDGDE